MIHNLVLYHIKDPDFLGSIEKSDFVCWKTCLRSLYIGHKDCLPESKFFSSDLKESDKIEIYLGEEAYAFLLKLVCGLDSPLLAETEIFGQFRALVNSLSSKKEDYYKAQLLNILRQVIVDVKQIRETHLKGLGFQSYGSFLRNFIKDSRASIHILGGGHLTQEILPWFAKFENQIFVYLRSLEKRTPEFKKFSEFIRISPIENFFEGGLLNEEFFFTKKSQPTKNILIVAAPVSSNFFRATSLRNFSKIIDLRSQSSTDRIICNSHQSCIDLKQIFSQININKEKIQNTLNKSYALIDQKTKRRLHQSQSRPFGWDDIYA